VRARVYVGDLDLHPGSSGALLSMPGPMVCWWVGPIVTGLAAGETGDGAAARWRGIFRIRGFQGVSMSIARIGILTIPTRASRGEYEDKGGRAIHDWFGGTLTSPWEAVRAGDPRRAGRDLKRLCAN